MTPEMFAEWQDENLWRWVNKRPAGQPTDSVTPVTAGITVPAARGSMMIVDDFEAIRARLRTLRCPGGDPAQCPGHRFGDNGRCVTCNLHRFHLPAVAGLQWRGLRVRLG